MKNLNEQVSRIKAMMGLNENIEMNEVPSDFTFFQEDEQLTDLRDALDKNRMVSVAYVMKNGEVRHMLIRRYLSSYVPSDKPKTEKQLNMPENTDVIAVIDMNAYQKNLKDLRTQGVNDDEAKAEASKKAWRRMKLTNVLGFMVGGNFIDLRDENDILARYGEQIYNSLTKGMINAMEVQANQGEENN